jgi:periplasmic protein TonB
VAPAPTPEPSPPAVAARPPEPTPGTSGSARPAPPAEPSESPLSGQRFSLLSPKLSVPPLPAPSGRGGTQSEGTGAGESGTESEGQIAVPLNTPDPRYADYFAELKRRIEDKWVYPEEAARKGQSGRGELRFVLRKDGSVRTVEIVSSSGIRILDSYIQNAIRMAQPFPPIPASVGDDVIPISINFTYVLGGIRAFGFR